MRTESLDCPCLRTVAGKRYRLCHEDGRKLRAADSPWLATLLCKYGHVFPWGRNKLAVSVDGFPRIAKRIQKLAGCQVVQDGDSGELTATFAPSDFPTVAKIVKPRTRREMSAAQRAALVEHGRKSQFPGVDAQYSDRRRDASAPSDSRATGASPNRSTGRLRESSQRAKA